MNALQVAVVVLSFGAVLSLTPIAYKTREVSNDSFVEGPELRIYGGAVAVEGAFPYMVFVLLRQQDGRINQCSASLVRSNWVLLAAHCVYHYGLTPRDVLVIGGKHDLASYVKIRLQTDFYTPLNEDALGVQERRANRFLYHPKYDPRTLEHDFALIEVTSPFVLGPTNTIEVSQDKMKTKKSCTILGWGLTLGNRQTFKLNYVDNKLVSTTKIGCLYKPSGPFICLQPDSRGICQGDSGSPLVCDGKVWGVASHLVSYNPTPDCGDSSEEYYSEAYADLDWLRSVYGSPNLSSPVSLSLLLLLLSVLASLCLSPKL